MSVTKIVRLAVLLITALLAPAAWAHGIEIFYLSAPDCPYCQHWEARARGELLESPEGKAARLVDIRGETLRQPIEARHYPPEYQWVFREIGPTRGVPRFLLAVDGKIISTAYGTNAYRKTFLPALKEAVARKRMEKS
jgi:hypothetical protein